MAEILGLGLSHYPGLAMVDDQMGPIFSTLLSRPTLPTDKADPANWPEDMRREWADDWGRRAAIAHRAALVGHLDRLRGVLDDFAPDAVVIWGDDQYENFREDVIPPYTVCAYDDMEVRPWAEGEASVAMRGRPNAWGEGEDACFTVRGRPDIAKSLAAGLIEQGIDVAYAYKPL